MDLLDFNTPSLTFPSARPNSSSFGWSLGQTMQVIVDEVDDEGATCRTKADAPEIDGNLFIDEGFEGLAPGDIVTVTVDEAGGYDLWGRVV